MSHGHKALLNTNNGTGNVISPLLSKEGRLIKCVSILSSGVVDADLLVDWSMKVVGEPGHKAKLNTNNGTGKYKHLCPNGSLSKEGRLIKCVSILSSGVVDADLLVDWSMKVVGEPGHKAKLNTNNGS